MAIERLSATWLEIEAWAQREIESGRDDLEQPTTDDKSALRTQGAIAKLRELLALSEPSKGPQAVAIDYGR